MSSREAAEPCHAQMPGLFQRPMTCSISASIWLMWAYADTCDQFKITTTTATTAAATNNILSVGRVGG